MSLRENDQGQIIILAGFILAMGVIFFSVILHSAAFAGHQTIAQETADVNYDFKCLKNTYGYMLRTVSERGTQNPFDSAELAGYENQMVRLYALEGYAVTFAPHDAGDYAPNAKTAKAKISLSDGETTYIETVTFDLK
ncbi:MAG: hypothetical protein IB616_02335 [Methanosarcinales archaeon]|nr:MAG: hypothetical protein IB616_02335 [Methanosarcinales archaeon]